MKYSVALTSNIHEQVAQHLLQRRGDEEDLCFALWYPSQGRTRLTALIHRLVLPLPGERVVNGNASFMPAYFRRALSEAMAAGAGLAFLHSHIGPGWQGISDDDIAAELGIAPATFGATDLPLVGLTLATDEVWSARFWPRVGHRAYEGRWCHTVRVVGERLRISYADHLMPPPVVGPELERTVSAWGDAVQAHLARIAVGIIGAGSVGQLDAISVAKAGVQRVQVMDFDSVERVNRDRLLFATRRDALLGVAKVEVLAEGLRQGATAEDFEVEPLELSVVEEEGFRAALDNDVLFSGVDRPWPRSVLNLIAYAHLIPVIDGGVAIEAHPVGQGMLRANRRGHIAGPGHKCIECIGQYDPAMVALERSGLLDDPHYIAGLPEDHPIRRKENVFPFSLGAACMEVDQFLALVADPLELAYPGAQLYRFNPGMLVTDPGDCHEGCLYPGLVAKGDRSGLVVTGRHEAAERERERRRSRQSVPPHSIK